MLTDRFRVSVTAREKPAAMSFVVGVLSSPRRTYEKVCAIRCVQTTDYMTADWYHMPYEILGRISNRIINEVRGINRVTYDISSKPPATIEWE